VALRYGGVGKFCGESVSGHEKGKVGFDVSLGKSVALSYRSVAKFCGESISVHERGMLCYVYFLTIPKEVDLNVR
jgi:hypothetical protein